MSVVDSRSMMHIPGWVLKFLPSPLKYWLDRHARIVQAGHDFRASFLKELRGLYRIPSDWPNGTGIEAVLREKFAALQMAVETYKPFLSDKERTEFDTAWVTFFCALKGRREQTYLHYMNITSASTNSLGGETIIKNDGKATFKRNVDRLLSFANGR